MCFSFNVYKYISFEWHKTCHRTTVWQVFACCDCDVVCDAAPLVLPENSDWPVLVTSVKMTTEVTVRLVGPDHSVSHVFGCKSHLLGFLYQPFMVKKTRFFITKLNFGVWIFGIK